MDSVRIILTKDCDENGDSGKIVEDVVTILAPLPDNSSAIDALVAAFADAYPFETYDNPKFDSEQPESDTNPAKLAHAPYRNFTIKLRKYSEEIVKPFLKKAMQKQLDAQAEAVAASVFGGVTVIDKKEKE